MPFFCKRDRRADEGDPDEKVDCQFLGPWQGMVKDVTKNDLEERHQYESREQNHDNNGLDPEQPFLKAREERQ